MTKLSQAGNVNPEASLVIGGNLCVEGASSEWLRRGLPAGNARERVDKVFPASGIGRWVLDVLSSGKAVENVVLRLKTKSGERFVCASFRPLPSAVKPKKVIMRALELDGKLTADGETGQILEANSVAEAYLGQPEGGSIWDAEPMQDRESRDSVLSSLTRNGSHYLGRYNFRRPDGSEVELESALVLVDE